jgi:hypothetical protein
MKNHFEKIINFIKQHQVQAMVLVLPCAYFLYNLVQMLSKPGQVAAFSMADFAMIAPLYLPISLLIFQLTWFLFVVLYVLSFVFYSLALSVLTGWIQEWLKKMRHRPVFQLKQI